ncbi:hypothetical protein NQD34_000941 [Periophthalmus magnuspinnatus]|nr:hypothetical protein NQD34_000941 [Periophthalmus magnuspinnatus]
MPLQKSHFLNKLFPTSDFPFCFDIDCENPLQSCWIGPFLFWTVTNQSGDKKTSVFQGGLVPCSIMKGPLSLHPHHTFAFNSIVAWQLADITVNGSAVFPCREICLAQG